MVRAPCFDSNGMKKGAWSEEEDNKLRAYVLTHGHSNWRLLPKYAGLARCGKSCRLRWVNYLKPGVKRGNFTKEEEDLIIKLHAKFGKKWSIIATYLAGRTDNDIKNFWNAHIEKRQKRKVKLHEENLSSASTIKLQEPTLPFDTTFSQASLDLWPDHDQKVCLPPFVDPEWFFLYDDDHHDHYTSKFERIADDFRDQDEYVAQVPAVQGSFLSESFALDNLNSQNGITCCYDHIPPPLQQVGGFYDPYFDHFLS